VALDRMTIMNIHPRLVEAADGSWLAIAGGAPIRLGVVGETADEARLRFGEALAQRADLAEGAQREQAQAEA
jgi:hypothetical protein